jgi:Signal transduction histidine kinase
MKLTLRVKMIISFLLILAVSYVITFFGAVFVSKNPISEEIKEGQFSYADTLLTLSRQTNLSARDIMDVNINSFYGTRILDDIDKSALSGDIKSRLDKGEKVYVFNKPFTSPTTLIKLGDETVKITIRKQDVFETFRFRIALALLSLLIIACTILALASTRMLKPVLKLTEATQKVAAGDFNVTVDIRSNDEIGILIKNFNRMAKELGAMEYLQKDFIRNVSHEFKTPIASIQGFARLLQNEGLPEEDRKEFSGIILEETNRLSRLSSNILRLSKLENQKEPAAKNEFNLDEQLRSVIVLLEPEWSKKELELDVSLEASVCSGDEELLQQVWINLIENAIKFSRQNGTIFIRSAKKEQMVEVEVTDTGIGMDAATQERVFERFYQGNASHSSEGSGLGLSIVKRILELSGGEIQIKSSLNQGTSFLVRLPN